MGYKSVCCTAPDPLLAVVQNASCCSLKHIIKFSGGAVTLPLELHDLCVPVVPVFSAVVVEDVVVDELLLPAFSGSSGGICGLLVNRRLEPPLFLLPCLVKTLGSSWS